MYLLYIGSFCNVAFHMARFTCSLTSQVFMKIRMQWSISWSSAFHRSRENIYELSSALSKAMIIYNHFGQKSLLNALGKEAWAFISTNLNPLQPRTTLCQIWGNSGEQDVFVKHNAPDNGQFQQRQRSQGKFFWYRVKNNGTQEIQIVHFKTLFSFTNNITFLFFCCTHLELLVLILLEQCASWIVQCFVLYVPDITGVFLI